MCVSIIERGGDFFVFLFKVFIIINFQSFNIISTYFSRPPPPHLPPTAHTHTHVWLRYVVDNTYNKDYIRHASLLADQFGVVPSSSSSSSPSQKERERQREKEPEKAKAASTQNYATNKAALLQPLSAPRSSGQSSSSSSSSSSPAAAAAASSPAAAAVSTVSVFASFKGALFVWLFVCLFFNWF